MPGDLKAFGQLTAGGVEFELNDRHRRNRRQIMRIKHAEERVRKLRKFVIEFVVDPSRQQSKRLDHSLDVRIATAGRLEQQASCRGGIPLGKFLRKLTDEDQLAFVIRV